MSRTSLTDEQKELFEKEYSEFLVEKIKSAGGCIQFQHLIGLLSQLKFDVKQAVGCSKLQLMKFLKTNCSTFKIDNKGIVSITESTTANSDNSDDEKSVCKNSKCLLPSDIKEGKGKISSILTDYGFINAVYPFKTSVYFTASELSIEKNQLLSDFDIFVGCHVCFNASKGLDDFDAQYCASKVWRDNVEDESNVEINPKFRLNKNNSSETSQLNSVGVIEKIYHNVGFVINDNWKQPISFNKSHLDSEIDIEDLTKIFSKGEKVDIIANKIIKQGQPQWQIIEVKKKKGGRYSSSIEKESVPHSIAKCYDSSSSTRNHNYHSSYDVKKQHSLKTTQSKKHKEMIKDQCGKIDPHSHGVDIMFGDKFSQKADGNSSVYFLYGSQVKNTEISWEFSQGDDVYFDAVKIKSEPGWKAVIVWAGEKPDFVLPTCMGDFSEFTDEETEEVNDTSKLLASSSEMKNSSLKSEIHLKQQNKKKFKRNDSLELDSTSSNSSTVSNKKMSKYNFNSDPLVTSSEMENSSLKSKIHVKQQNKNKFKRNDSLELDSTSSNSSTISSKKHSKYNFNSDPPVISKNKKSLKCPKNMYKKDDYEKNTCVKNNLPIDNEDEYFIDCNEDLSQLNSKISDVSNNKEIILYSKKNCKNNNNEIKRPRIKTFENSEGKVLKVYCKYVVVENHELQEPLSLFLSHFYFDGLSAEEQFYNNLIDVIKVGDTVTFNCFEIIDDSGGFHRLVTAVWKGIKPEIEEVTLEDVIQMYKLSVTLDENSLVSDTKEKYNLQTPHVKKQNKLPKKFLSVMSIDSDATDDEFAGKSSNDETCVTKSSNYCLSQIISEKLKSCGICFSDSKVDLHGLSTEIINLVLKHDDSKLINISPSTQRIQHARYEMETLDFRCPTCTSYSKVPKEDVTTNHKEVQTIITGEIIAQRTEFSFARQAFGS